MQEFSPRFPENTSYMYAYEIEIDETRPEVDFELDPGAEQIHYWRKPLNLHGWMERLYHNKGGSNPDFNCNTVLLTPDDIDNLESAIKGKTLPETPRLLLRRIHRRRLRNPR